MSEKVEIELNISSDRWHLISSPLHFSSGGSLVLKPRSLKGKGLVLTEPMKVFFADLTQGKQHKLQGC